MAKPKVKSKRCGCLAALNRELKEQNAEVDGSLQIDFAAGAARIVFQIPLKKIKPSRKKLPVVVCTYCPVCGRKVQP